MAAATNTPQPATSSASGADDELKPGKEWAESANVFNSKKQSEYVDPCAEAAARSLRCMHRNGGEREMCGDYFQAYRDCKAQWLKDRKEAKRKANKMTWF